MEYLMPSHPKTNIDVFETILPFLRAVSNTTRLKILYLLLEGERCVGDINHFQIIIHEI